MTMCGRGGGICVVAAFILLLGVSHARVTKVSDDELLKIFEKDVSSVENQIREDFTDDELDEVAIILKRLMLRHQTKNMGIDYAGEKDAAEWLEGYNAELAARNNRDAKAQWAYLTDINDYNAKKATRVSVENENWFQTQLVHAKRFHENADKFEDVSIKRQIHTILHNRMVPLSQDPEVRRKLSQLDMKMEGVYASTKVKAQDGTMLALDPGLEHIMHSSRDYDELVWVWTAWRDAVGPRIKALFIPLVENMNKAARENGMTDVGEAWRVADFDDNDIEETVVRLWDDVKPLYRLIHAYTRKKLADKYPQYKGGKREPIPAHLLGNMWAQSWSSISGILKPYPEISYDVGRALKDKGYNVDGLFKMADEFFQSLGMAPMTATFWEKSMLKRPEGNKVVECHASAEDFFKHDDYRIKMCAGVSPGSMETIHHEMGHIQYYMQYAHQPTLFRDGANAAFHEAVGDTISLSVNTPKHFSTIGLLSETGGEEPGHVHKSDINFLMEQALTLIVFLPFGYLVDKFRWDVFSGEVEPDRYNEHWWKLRLEMQGLKPPVKRTEADFDPGAKFHVAGNVPYLRYFLSHIGQFQFYDAMCDAAGHTDLLHRCDFYNSKAAGKKLTDMLSLGSSLPWGEAMETITGQTEFRSEAILEYFKPLHEWLEHQVDPDEVGWDGET